MPNPSPLSHAASTCHAASANNVRRESIARARRSTARSVHQATQAERRAYGGAAGQIQRAVLALNFVSLSARPDVALCSSKICCIRLAIAGGVLGTSTDVHSARRAASRNMDAS